MFFFWILWEYSRTLIFSPQQKQPTCFFYYGQSGMFLTGQVRSPDLSPAEHVFHLLEMRMKTKSPKVSSECRCLAECHLEGLTLFWVDVLYRLIYILDYFRYGSLFTKHFTFTTSIKCCHSRTNNIAMPIFLFLKHQKLHKDL